MVLEYLKTQMNARFYNRKKLSVIGISNIAKNHARTSNFEDTVISMEACSMMDLNCLELCNYFRIGLS